MKSAHAIIARPLRNIETLIARIKGSGSVSIAVPCTTIVTGTRNSTMSHAAEARAIVEEDQHGAASSTTPEIKTQNARIGIGAGIRLM